MTPTIPDVLAELAGLLARNAMPDVDPADRTSALGLSALLLGAAAQDWDRAAARLFEENAAIRAIFATAPVQVAGAELSARLSALAAGSDTDLRISALEAANAVLRAALIELHAAAEACGSAEGRALEDQIWAELAASTDRRKLAGAPV